MPEETEERNIFEHVDLHSPNAGQELIKFFGLPSQEEMAEVKTILEGAVAGIASATPEKDTQPERGVPYRIQSMLSDLKSREMIEALRKEESPLTDFGERDPEAITTAAVMAGTNPEAWRTIAQNLFSAAFQDEFFGMTDDQKRTPLLLIAKQRQHNGVGMYLPDYNPELLTEALDFISPSHRKDMLIQEDKSHLTAAISAVHEGSIEGMQAMVSRLEPKEVAPVLLSKTANGLFSAYNAACENENTRKEAYRSIAKSVRCTIKNEGEEGLQYLLENTPKSEWALPLLLERGEPDKQNAYEMIIEQDDPEIKTVANKAIGQSLAIIRKQSRDPNNVYHTMFTEALNRVGKALRKVNIHQIPQVMRTAYEDECKVKSR